MHSPAIAREAEIGRDCAGRQAPPATVLVVDDELGPRESLRMILAPGHRVLTAANAREALVMLAEHEVDLVTLDLQMPGMRGDELMRVVRARHPEVEVIVITGCSSVETAVDGMRLGVRDYLMKPFDVVQVSAATTRALGRRRSRRRLVGFLEEVASILGLGLEAEDDAALQALSHDTAAQEQLRALLSEPALDPAPLPGSSGDATEFLETLAETIEQRDPQMRGHSRRVAATCARLAEAIGLDAEQCSNLRIAAFLHDLGKVGIAPETIPSSAVLDAVQRASVQRHAEMGARLVRPLGLSAEVASAIRHHHERWDGRGYPDGLRGDEIPLLARIIAIADAFDAMQVDRGYRAPRSAEQARAELRREAWRQFDPHLVQTLLSLVETGRVEGGALQ